MKYFLLIQILTLISLSSQFHHHAISSIDEELSFPIKAAAVIRGEVRDAVTNELCKISGIVRFLQETQTSKVKVTVDVKGLPKHSSDVIVKRGFHIHSYTISDYSDNITAVCTSTGPHFNPTNETHGDLNSKIRHNGDLGNLNVMPDGTINASFVDDRLALFGKYSIVGRSLVLHGGEDDLGLKNTDASHNFGTSGQRIACGVIGLDKSEIKSVARSLIALISGQDVPIVKYLSLEESTSNSTNDTITYENDGASDIDDEMNALDEMSKVFPQAIPVFRLFYKILNNVVESTRYSNFQLMKALSQLQLNPVLEINATLPFDIFNMDNSTTGDFKLTF